MPGDRAITARLVERIWRGETRAETNEGRGSRESGLTSQLGAIGSRMATRMTEQVEEKEKKKKKSRKALPRDGEGGVL